jgi:hypothetical protein
MVIMGKLKVTCAYQLYVELVRVVLYMNNIRKCSLISTTLFTFLNIGRGNVGPRMQHLALFIPAYLYHYLSKIDHAGEGVL